MILLWLAKKMVKMKVVTVTDNYSDKYGNTKLEVEENSLAELYESN